MGPTDGARRGLRLVFAMAHTGHLRNFESVARELLARGHRILFAFDRLDAGSSTAPLLSLLENEGAGSEVLPVRPLSATVGVALRFALDYGRYLEPPLVTTQSKVFGVRAGTRVPLPLRRALEIPRLRRVLLRAIRSAERRPAAPGGIGPLLDRARPDALVITPLVELGSPQTEHLRAARQRGIPTVVAAPSWDSLTSKGGIHELPDCLLVWNELQRGEALDLHGVSSERVAVVGASAYDHLFELEPVGRDELCAAAGLDPSRAYVLYLVSSSFITPGESEFVAEWAGAVRSALDVQILVRPHPTNPVDATNLPVGAVVHPRGGADPVLTDARREYMASIAHASAVVAINTSGMIESAALGRPVLSVLEPRYRATQEGALHFRYLLPAQGGMLEVSRTLYEHVTQLAEAISNPDRFQERNSAFIESFVRPQGVERLSAAAADTIEAAAAREPIVRAVDQPRAARRAMTSLVRVATAALIAVRTLRGRATVS